MRDKQKREREGIGRVLRKKRTVKRRKDSEEDKILGMYEGCTHVYNTHDTFVPPTQS